MGHIIAQGGAYGGEDRTGCLPEYIVKSSGKENPKFVLLPTPKNDDYDETTNPEIPFFESCGARVEVLKLTKYKKGDKYIEDTLMSADIIYVTGGNLATAMRIFQETGTDELLKKAYEKGTLMAGSSSGAMCWFERGFDNCGVDGSFMFVNTLGILPGCFCPHYDSQSWKAFNFQVKQQSLSAVGVENGVAIEYKDGVYSLAKEIGHTAYFFDAENGFKKHKIGDKAQILNKRVGKK